MRNIHSLSGSYFDTCLYRLNPIKSYIEKAVKTESDNVQSQEIKAQANHTEIGKTTFQNISLTGDLD